MSRIAQMVLQGIAKREEFGKNSRATACGNGPIYRQGLLILRAAMVGYRIDFLRQKKGKLVFGMVFPFGCLGVHRKDVASP